MVLTLLKAKPERKLAKQICKVVLDHFEKQYSKELGDAWNTVRFNYPFELEKDLHLKGYHSLFQGSLPYYPKSMKCYLSRTPHRMPSERHQIGNLKKYYLLNAASLLPVLALELRDGEKVLDLCAAPGGKSLALLQCAYPGYLHCNEYDSLRLRWLRQTLESFIPQPLVNVIKVSELDGREMGDAQPETFDKVLVDAPCSNDRSWLFSSDSQKAACRISQRRNLPLLQIELLRNRKNDPKIYMEPQKTQNYERNPEEQKQSKHSPPRPQTTLWSFSNQNGVVAQKQTWVKGRELRARNKPTHQWTISLQQRRSAIKALRPGGLLVYSTCTLSKAENQDVISEVLNSYSDIMPVDIKEMARTCSQDFTFAPTGQECGLLVIPDKGKAWGPMYVAKLKKSWTT
ncbi:tRNA (cytosine(34)-C(5))-methyltransferase, mitochondrial isoform 2-T2 [Dama dama]|uniref:tRNA (cytosine(34)-C(5))-methyltransferase, mitochondrial isoform X2 n=1 Tax=Dama dama TaxID=30532 RepID=UPI002A35BB1A|nr:tRNA (cytosine(34)-C(5))-methyltransferase, mitochondrial isoform X2 [Dama dama]